MQRLKRVVNKPTRYQTTSSDEGPKRQRSTAPATTTSRIIQDDIDEIQRELQDEDTSFINNINTNIESYTNIHTYANTTFTDSLHAHTQTNTHTPHIQTNTNTYTHTTPQIIFENTENLTENMDYTDKIYYTNSTLPQTLVAGPKTWQQDAPAQRMHEQRAQQMQRPTYQRPKDAAIEKCNAMEGEIKKMREQLNTMEAEMKKMNGILNKILKCVQERNTAPQKPALFPISSLEQMVAFENVNEEEYSNTVNYLHYIGGFNLKEAVHLCLKEALSDSLTALFTWYGREEGRRPLYNTRLIRAVYDAVCKNRHFEKPMRSEFQKQMRESLRVAKERNRSRTRGPRTQDEARRINQDLWMDDEADDDEDNIGE